MSEIVSEFLLPVLSTIVSEYYYDGDRFSFTPLTAVNILYNSKDGSPEIVDNGKDDGDRKRSSSYLKNFIPYLYDITKQRHFYTNFHEMLYEKESKEDYATSIAEDIFYLNFSFRNQYSGSILEGRRTVDGKDLLVIKDGITGESTIVI